MNSNKAHEHLLKILNEKAINISQDALLSYKNITKNIGNARFVLIGEATHGTHEFYHIRAEITKELILNHGFMAVAIEGDWPDVYEVNQYIKGVSAQKNVEEVLKAFSRFPRWMWRNPVIASFTQWLRDHNEKMVNINEKIGFYGLDLYSLNTSLKAVIEYLKKVDPNAAARALERYACFDHLSFDPESYGYLISKGIKESCVKKAVEQLMEIQHNAIKYIKRNGFQGQDDYFYATQNARLVKNAEMYYRSHFEGRVSSWNVRDTHMAETLNYLCDHLENNFKRPAKVIIWAHNSHVGDARATQMSEEGEVNIGQLVREQHEADTYIIGFSTYQGTVRAASHWGGKSMKKIINLGMKGSYEALFHELALKNFAIHLKGDENLEHYLKLPRLQRAIGVIYRADTERQSHYFFTRLPYQFDTLIHIDETTALEALINGKN